jgi:hypothetical protein
MSGHHPQSGGPRSDDAQNAPCGAGQFNIVQAIFRCAHLANTIQYGIEEVTGARVSSVLFGCSLGELDLTPRRMTLHFTKPGFDVPVALPDPIRPLLDEYQVRAGFAGPGSDEPLFLTPRGVPYKNAAYTGTRNKTARNAAKRRATVVIGRDHDSATLAFVARFWHKSGTRPRRGGDVKTIDAGTKRARR